MITPIKQEDGLNLTEENDSLLFLEQDIPEAVPGILPGMASFSTAY